MFRIRTRTFYQDISPLDFLLLDVRHSDFLDLEMCERGGHVRTGWSRVDGVWSCERGRHVNWVRCDKFYFELLIRHLEKALEKHLIADM